MGGLFAKPASFPDYSRIVHKHVDLQYWSKLSLWTLQEAVLILNRIEPRHGVESDSDVAFPEKGIKQALIDTKLLLERAIQSGDLPHQVKEADEVGPRLLLLKPLDLAQWAKSKAVRLPVPLESLLWENHNTIDWESKYREEVSALQQQKSELEEALAIKEISPDSSKRISRDETLRLLFAEFLSSRQYKRKEDAAQPFIEKYWAHKQTQWLVEHGKKAGEPMTAETLNRICRSSAMPSP